MLVEIEGRPWGEFGRSGKPMSPNQLARMLKPLGIAPEVIRTGAATPRGYMLVQFGDAFRRYLASKPQQRNNVGQMGTSSALQTATPDAGVAVRKTEKPNNDGRCCGVALENPGGVGEGGLAADEGQEPDPEERILWTF
jgi:hypothetical protein